MSFSPAKSPPTVVSNQGDVPTSKNNLPKTPAKTEIARNLLNINSDKITTAKSPILSRTNHFPSQSKPESNLYSSKWLNHDSRQNNQNLETLSSIPQQLDKNDGHPFDNKTDYSFQVRSQSLINPIFDVRPSPASLGKSTLSPSTRILPNASSHLKNGNNIKNDYNSILKSKLKHPNGISSSNGEMEENVLKYLHQDGFSLKSVEKTNSQDNPHFETDKFSPSTQKKNKKPTFEKKTSRRRGRPRKTSEDSSDIAPTARRKRGRPPTRTEPSAWRRRKNQNISRTSSKSLDEENRSQISSENSVDSLVIQAQTQCPVCRSWFASQTYKHGQFSLCQSCYLQLFLQNGASNRSYEPPTHIYKPSSDKFVPIVHPFVVRPQFDGTKDNRLDFSGLESLFVAAGLCIPEKIV